MPCRDAKRGQVRGTLTPGPQGLEGPFRYQNANAQLHCKQYEALHVPWCYPLTLQYYLYVHYMLRLLLSSFTQVYIL